MQKIRIKYSKGPEVKFISHLDVIRLFERTIRRSGLPVGYSAGFNPRMKLAWGPPLPLGVESDCEMMDIMIDGWVKPAGLMDSLNKVLPPGVKVLGAELANPKAPSLDCHINRASYAVGVKQPDAEALKEMIGTILAKDALEFEKKGKVINKRRMLHELRLKEGPFELMFTVQVGSDGTLKPFEVVGLFAPIVVGPVKRVALFSV